MLSVNKKQRGLTLVELLVAAFVLVLIMTVVFGTLMSVSNGIEDNQKRLAMQDTALWIAEEVTGALEAAVPHSSVRGDYAEINEPVFESDHIFFLTSQRYAAEGLESVEFAVDAPDSEYGVQVNMRRNNADQEKSMEVPKRLSHDLEGLEARIDFRYYKSGSTSQFKPGEADDPRQAMPGLVEFVITVSDKSEELADYQIQSAVNLR